jgi:hypothetical protein
MKHICMIAAMGLTSLLFGCTSVQVAVAPVGPNPNREALRTSDGQLEVFSAITGRTEGDDPTWFQHTDYTIYNQQQQSVKHVFNALGHYSSAPRAITLPPGKYFVKARAKDYASVWVPVVIEPGRTTRVHLDDTWRPIADSKTPLIKLPSGTPVGWRIE